jgi:hypothetical protein
MKSCDVHGRPDSSEVDRPHAQHSPSRASASLFLLKADVAFSQPDRMGISKRCGAYVQRSIEIGRDSERTDERD